MDVFFDDSEDPLNINELLFDVPDEHVFFDDDVEDPNLTTLSDFRVAVEFALFTLNKYHTCRIMNKTADPEGTLDWTTALQLVEQLKNRTKEILIPPRTTRVNEIPKKVEVEVENKKDSDATTKALSEKKKEKKKKEKKRKIPKDDKREKDEKRVCPGRFWRDEPEYIKARKDSNTKTKTVDSTCAFGLGPWYTCHVKDTYLCGSCGKAWAYDHKKGFVPDRIKKHKRRKT